MQANEAMARKAQADSAVDRAAGQLRALLQETAKELRPFPPYPGAFFTNAVEVQLSGIERPDLGCIVVAEDGELYELEMKIDFSDDLADPVQARDETLKRLDELHPRDETLKKLDELHPRDYVVLAYNALTQLTELIIERAESR